MHRCLNWRRCLLAAAGILGLASTGQGDEFPYTATVNSADVFVRSGPGKNYYPTDKLSKGEKVEVYRLDPGGWCAIRRRRKASVGWRRGKFDPISNDLALVNGDRVVARVGSALSSVRDVIQVRLDRGEKVEILESAKSTGGHWCKIAPPSGEFRWVFVKFLDRDSTAGDSLAEQEHEDAEGAQSAIRLTAGTSADTTAAPAAEYSGSSGAAGSGGTASLEPMSHDTPQSERPPLDRLRHVPPRTYGSPRGVSKRIKRRRPANFDDANQRPEHWSWDARCTIAPRVILPPANRAGARPCPRWSTRLSGWKKSNSGRGRSPLCRRSRCGRAAGRWTGKP